MSKQSNNLEDEAIASLRDDVDRVLAQYYLHPDPNKFRDTGDKLTALLHSYITNKEREARIDELNTLYPRFTDIRLDGTNGSEHDSRALGMIDERLTELQQKDNGGSGT